MLDSKVAARTDYAGHYAYHALVPVTTFVERPALHQRLRAQLHDPTPDVGQTTRLVAVYGAGGAGKSQLVLNYIQQHRCDYGAVFWIEAGTTAAVERDFVQMYQLLYNVHNHSGLGSVRVKDAVPAVKRWFYGRQQRSLFVFDSADNVEHEQEPSYVDLRYFLPDDPSVQVVITTRNATLRKMGQLGGVEVAEMAGQEATALFLKQAEMDVVGQEEEAEVGNIVKELGYLALAVTLAGSYVATSPRLRGDIKQYLPEYRQRRKELLKRQPDRLVHQYGASVLTTWETSFEAVRRQNVYASQLLCLLGFLHWDGIFISLFETGDREAKEEGRERSGEEEGAGKGKEGEQYQANKDRRGWKSVLFSSDTVSLYDIEQQLSVLQTYSLLKFQCLSNSYSMHKLIHAWVSDRLSNEARTRHIQLSIMVLGDALNRTQHHSPEKKARLIPHLMSNFTRVLANIQELQPTIPAILNYFQYMAAFTNSAGRWNETLLIKQTILKQVSLIYGEEHPNTISATNNLANTLGDMGELQTAVIMKQEVVEKSKHILGEEHPDTISAMNNLASTLGDMGKLQTAVKMKQEVVEKSKYILGEEHPDTISAMNNLANTLGDMGELQTAVKMKQEVVEKSKYILGEEHPDTISAMNNLANTLGDMGELQAAMIMQQEVVEKRKYILGEEHPDTISAMNNLANTLGDMGELQTAVKMKQEVVEKRKHILGEEHPDTISAMNNLAITLGDMGELQTAVKMKQEVVEKRKHILGEEHPDTISAMNNLAITLGDMGKLQTAVKMKQEVVEKRKYILGEEHPDTISAMNNLAITLGDMGELQAAMIMQQEVVEKRKRILGEKHPKTISAMNNLQILGRCMQEGTQPSIRGAEQPTRHSRLRSLLPWRKRRL